MEQRTGPSRTQPLDRVVRTGPPKISSGAYRQLLTQRLLRLGDRVTG